MHSSFPTAEPAREGARARRARRGPAWLSGWAARLRGGTVRLPAGAALLAVLAVAGALAWQGLSSLSARVDEAQKAQRALAVLAELRLTVATADLAARGIAPGLMAGPVAPLPPARARIDGQLDELRQLSASQPEQYSRLLALAPLLVQRLDLLDRVAARPASANAAAGGWEASDDNRRSLDRIGAALVALEAPAATWLAQAQERREAAARWAWQLLLASALLGIATTAWLAHRQRSTAARLTAVEQETSQVDAQAARQVQQHQRLMGSTLTAVCLIDAEGRFTHLSPAAARLLGAPTEALLGRPLVARTVPDDLRKTERALEQAAVAPQALQHRLRHADGRVQHLVWTLDPAGDGSVIAVPTDVSPAQALGEANAQQARTLQAEQAARTDADARATRAERQLAEFSGTLGRCLKGPLAALERLSDNARADLGESPAARPWAVVRERSLALQRAVDDVLALGQVHAGLVPLQREAFDLWETVNDVLQPLRALAERKGLTVSAQLAEDLGYAHGDTRRVEHALTALLRDAIDVAGSGTLAVAATRSASRVDVVVTHERAPGEAHDIEGLLAPLHDPDLPCAPERMAHLLGLAMARALAQRMGGDLVAAWPQAAAGPCVLTLTLPADELPGR